MKIVTVAEMHRLEQQAEVAGVSIAQLMENAGLAVAQEAWMLLGTLEERVILVLAGPGNNGGDGLVAARTLFDWGAEVRVYLVRPRPDDAHYQELIERGVPLKAADEDPGLERLRTWLTEAHLVIDALLGASKARPIEGTMAAVLEQLAAARQAVLAPKLLAVDLPTGVDADTGAADPHTVPCDQTVALGLPKLGLFTVPGSEKAGRVQTVEIGLPSACERELPVDLLTAAWTREHLPARAPDANKGSFGKVMVAAGSINFIGAAFLSSAAAYRTGAGLVTLAVPAPIQLALAPMLPEATFLPLEHDEGAFVVDCITPLKEALGSYDVLLTGCGVSQKPYAQQFIRALLYGLKLDQLQGLVVDADGLNALAAQKDWARKFTAEAILTPHPGEFSRLAGVSIPEVQSDRLQMTLRHARAWNKIVVLKGANTVVAHPDGRAFVSPFANPALATAGTGDVLAGTIAGLLAQGVTPFEAAAAGVYLHAAAGELLSRDFGDAGGLAADLVRLLPEARREILQVR